MSLAGTANTPVAGSTAGVASATLQMKAGDRLNLIIAGTMTNLAACNVTLYLTRWQ
jgi:hypothetical protein